MATYKVKLKCQDLMCYTVESQECPQGFPREWFAYSTALVKFI